MNDNTTMNRRKMLGVTALAGVSGLSGCIGFDGLTCSDEELHDNTDRFYPRQNDIYTVDTDDLDTDKIRVRAVRIDPDGARPSVKVTHPSGPIVLQDGPSEVIDQEITLNREGKYSVKVFNEAVLTSGTFSTTIEEVC